MVFFTIYSIIQVILRGGKMSKRRLTLLAFLVLSSALFLSGCGFINQSPSASFNANPTSGEVPLTVSFDATSSSDPDGMVLGYDWNFGDNHTDSGKTVTHTYENAGTYTVQLTAVDDKGAEDTVTKTITVSPKPSGTPEANFTASPSSGEVPLEVSFDASGSSDPDGQISSYEWDFDDGEMGSGKTTDHTFDSSGAYTVRLTVTDDKGNKDSYTQEVEVTPKQSGDFSGVGDTVTRTFSLPEGVIVFDLTHNGDSNFIVQLKNAETGELEGNLVNEIGAFNGEVLVGASWDNSPYSLATQNRPLDVKTTPGDFKLEITANGSWNIDYTRDDPTVGVLELPQRFSGTGYQATQPIELPAKEVTFSFVHEGDSNFIVTLYRKNGGYQELLANEIGEYSGKTIIEFGSESYQPSSGVYYVSVMADGQWVLHVEADVKVGYF